MAALFPKNVRSYKEYLPLGNVELDPAGLVEFSYKKGLEKLNSLKGYEVQTFSYDWRVDNRDNVEKLHDFLGRQDRKYDEINIVAHSMGGILTRLLFNRYNEESYISKVKNFITLGTPWHGALDSYRTYAYGKDVPETPPAGLVLSANTAKNLAKGFPSLYQLFPDDEYESRLHAEYNLPVLSINGESYGSKQIFEMDDLKKDLAKLSYEYQSLIGEYRDDLLSVPDNTHHINHHEILGFGITTLTSIESDKRGEILAHFKNGDGTVPYFSAKSNFYTKRYFIKKATHNNLVKNKNALQVVESILSEEEVLETNDVFIDEGKVKEIGYKSKIVRIACPVDVTIVKDGQSIFGYSDTLEFEKSSNLVDPNINIFSLGNTTYLILDKEEDVQEDELIIEAYDEGATNVSIEQVNKENSKKSVRFKTFQINPYMRAKLNLSEDIEDTKLIIRNEENDSEEVEDPIEIEEVDFQLPSTLYLLDSDFTYNQNQLNIFSGEVKLTIGNIFPGTYEVKETYISVNGKLQKLDDSIPNEVELDQGENNVKVFSVDAYGNEEEAESVEVLYVSDISPNIYTKVLPHQYKIETKTNDEMARLIRQHQLPNPTINYEINNEENTYQSDDTVTVLTNRPIVREFVIRYSAFLGEYTEQISVDEQALQTIFDGIANAQNLIDILTRFDMYDPSQTKIKMPKLEGVGPPYSNITASNITNSKSINAKYKNKELEIVKMSEYDISFYNLNEDIRIDQNRNYVFLFKIFDNNDREIRTLEVDAFLKISIQDDEIFTNEDAIEVRFDRESDLYEGVLDITNLQELLEQYWEQYEIQSAELIITKSTVSTNVIRAKDLNIRRN